MAVVKTSRHKMKMTMPANSLPIFLSVQGKRG